MSKKLLLIALFPSAFLVGCAQQPPQPSYEQHLAQIPPPSDEKDRQKKCAYLRSEIARQQNIAMVGGAQLQGMYALTIQATARKNIAALEARASDFSCYAAFSNRPSTESVPIKSDIEACVETCKANTSRTPEQCFDACNH